MSSSSSGEDDGDGRLVTKAQYERDLKEDLETNLPKLRSDAFGAGQWMSIPRPDALDHTIDESGNIIYFSRWLMLFYLAALNLVSDWVCFSLAPISHIADNTYTGVSVSVCVTVFLCSNFCFSFVEPLVIDRWGLRGCVTLGAILMFAGNITKSGISNETNGSYTYLLLGTVLVGAAQPFFQCSCSVLSANWFPANERTLATTLTLNANQVGIACAYIFGTWQVSSTEDIYDYFELITWISFALMVGVLLQFRSHPPTAPSRSQAGIVATEGDDDHRPYWTLVRAYTKERGFMQCMASFVCSIVVSNMCSTYFDAIMQPLGYSQMQVGLTGAGFQACIVFGSAIFGSYVDRTGNYYCVLMTTLFATSCLLLSSVFSLDDSLVYSTPLIMLFLGVFVGPIQPISTELSVEVTYPSNENHILASQQVAGNLFSAICVPLFEFFEDSDRDPFGGSMYLLLCITVTCMAFFATFNGEYRRFKVDH